MAEDHWVMQITRFCLIWFAILSLRCINQHTAALIKAVEAGEAAEVMYAAERGADVNVRIGESRSPILLTATRNGHAVIVNSLLNQGADPNAANKFGFTPLMYASMYMTPKSTFIAELLIEKGAEIDKVSNRGDTALMLACAQGNTGLVEYLLSRGANVHSADHANTTALDAALTRGDVAIVRALLDKGADPEKRADDGLSPTDRALYRQQNEIIALFAEKRKTLKGEQQKKDF